MATEAAAGVRRLRDKCCVLCNVLDHNLGALVNEAHDVLALEEDYNRLQQGYVLVLARVGAGISRLLAGDALDVASDMLGCWLRAEDATRQDMHKMQLVSRASRGTPVLLLAKKVQQAATFVSTTVPDKTSHKRCKKMVSALHEQVKTLSQRLLEAPGTLRLLLYLTRALPLLRQFEKKLDDLNVLDKPEQDTESTDEEELSALYCGGPLWTRLTAEVCHHRCNTQKLADLLGSRGTKRKRSPNNSTRTVLIGMLEDDLPPIKIPQLDPSLFKPLP